MGSEKENIKRKASIIEVILFLIFAGFIFYLLLAFIGINEPFVSFENLEIEEFSKRKHTINIEKYIKKRETEFLSGINKKYLVTEKDIEEYLKHEFKEKLKEEYKKMDIEEKLKVKDKDLKIYFDNVEIPSDEILTYNKSFLGEKVNLPTLYELYKEKGYDEKISFNEYDALWESIVKDILREFSTEDFNEKVMEKFKSQKYNEKQIEMWLDNFNKNREIISYFVTIDLEKENVLLEVSEKFELTWNSETPKRVGLFEFKVDLENNNYRTIKKVNDIKLEEINIMSPKEYEQLINEGVAKDILGDK